MAETWPISEVNLGHRSMNSGASGMSLNLAENRAPGAHVIHS